MSVVAPPQRAAVIVRLEGSEEAVTFDGKPQRLKQFEIDGPKRQFVWFDNDNNVVAFRTEEDGAPIDFVLTRRDASDAAMT